MKCGKNNNLCKEKISKKWAWGGSFGKDIRVVLIDSGVDKTHPKILNQNSIIFETSLLDTTIDDAGHGTACADILLDIAPQIELISIKVLDFKLKGSCEDLISALEWSIEHDVDVINLSLGCSDKEFKLKLFEILEKAYQKDIIVVVANSNDKTESYPAGFSSVITVVSHSKEYEGLIFSNPSIGVDFSVFANGREVAWKAHSSKIISGNSFASPYIAGKVACIKSKHPNLKPYEIKSILHILSDNNINNREMKIPSIYKESLEKISIVCQEVALDVFNIKLPPILFENIKVDSIDEQNLVNNYHNKVTIYSMDSSIYLSPSNGGSNMIYGITHEIGHILVSHLFKEKFLPAVIWDEALAHYFAIYLFIPKLWHRYKSSLWPDYPNYLEDNGIDILDKIPLDDYTYSLKSMTLILDEIISKYGYHDFKKACEEMNIEDMESWNFLKRLKSILTYRS